VAEWTRHAQAELDRGPWDRRAAIEIVVMEVYGRAIAVPDEIAQASLQRAIAVIGDLEPDDTAYVAHLLLQLSAAARHVGDPDAGLRWAERAAELIDRVGRPLHPVRPSAAEEIGLSIDGLGRCDEALPFLSQALDGYLAIGPDEIPLSIALAHGHIGDCLRDLDRPGPALAHYEAALPYWVQDHDDYGIREIRTHTNIARMLVALDRTEEAAQAYARAISVVNPLGPDHPLRETARRELAALGTARSDSAPTP
jgi:hypothetical protein